MLKLFLPEIFLTTSILIFLVVNSHVIFSQKYDWPLLTSELLSQIFVIVFICLILCCNQYYTGIEGRDLIGLFSVTSGAALIKIVFLVIVLFSLLPIWRAFVLQKLNLIEFFVIFLGVILSSFLITMATNFISLYLSLELQSICFYVLAAFLRTSIHSSEGALKYFIISSIFSCFFLLGSLSFYSVFGTTNYYDISLLLTFLSDSFYETHFYLFLKIGSIAMFIVFFFKLTVAPFIFWVPQAYDGAPVASTIIFTIFPKVIIYTALLHFWNVILSSLPMDFILEIFLYVGGYSILFGTRESLRQVRLKKLLIYSSVAQMGYPLILLVDNTIDSWADGYFFLIIYCFTSVVSWGFFVLLAQQYADSAMPTLQKDSLVKNEKAIRPLYLTTLSAVKNSNPYILLLLFLIFFSFSGIPPMVGFLSKLLTFFHLFNVGFYEFGVILAFIGVFSAYYYLRLVKVLIADSPKNTSINLSLFTASYLELEYTLYLIVGFGLIFFNFYPEFLYLLCRAIVLDTFFSF